MEDEDIINNDFLVDPTQNMGLSGVATSRDPLIAKGSRASDIVELGPEAFLDRSSYQNINDTYNYYLGGGSPVEPVIETPAITTPVITTPAVGTGGQDQSTSIQNQVTGDLNNQDSDQDIQTSNQINNSGITGDDIFMEDISSGDPYTGSLTVAPGLSNQTGTIQGAPDIFDINEIDDPALNPDSTMVQGLDPYGEEQPSVLDNISTAARNAFETVKSGASTALDFIKDYGYPAYQALQGNLVAAGTALASPLTLGLGFAGKVFESLGDTKSQEEYNLYSDEQKASIDAAYGPGGVMDGYNAVSGFGQGVQATVQSRLDQRRSSGIPDTSAASQELIGLQNNLGITDFTQLTQEQVSEMDDVDPADVGREINFETGEITQSNAADYLNELLDKNSAINTQKREMLSPERQAELTKEQDQVSKNITTLLNAFPETSNQVLADREKKTQANVELDLPTSSQDDSSEPTLSEADKEFAETGDYDVYSGGDTGATSSPTPAADYSYEGSDEQDEASNYDSTPSPASEPDQRDRGGDGSGGGGGGGGGKIVCTMMNENYGFGSFRNRIWQKYAKDNLTKEHEKGYHAIFLPLVKLSKTNVVIRKVLEHIAVHRTIDIRQEARGKVHILGRVYRKVLEPICYLVGKYVK
jgi:hypothetical protein